MHDQVIIANKIRPVNRRGCNGLIIYFLSGILIWRRHDPSVLILIELMHTKFVKSRVIGKLGVIDHIIVAILICIGGIMALGDLRHIHSVPLIIIHQLQSSAGCPEIVLPTAV